MRILMAQMNSTVGAFEQNFQKMKKILQEAESADLVVFPECAMTGYPPQDLLDYPSFAREAEAYNQRLIAEVKNRAFIFGSIERNTEAGRPCRNSALFVQDGKIVGRYFKRLLPSYDVFDEDRFFESGRSPLIVSFGGRNLVITICEDIWGDEIGTALRQRYQQTPLDSCTPGSVIINLSASPFELEKAAEKQKMLKGISERHQSQLLYVNSVGSHDGLIFDGRSYAWSSSGELMAEGKSFEEDLVLVDLDAPARVEPRALDEAALLYDALLLGIRDYCHKQGFSSGLVGMSGGIDSSVIVCLAADALGAQNIHGVLLPSRFTSRESNEDALGLAIALQNPIHILPIEPVFQAALTTLSKAFEGLDVDVTEENLQARSRGLLLMALSNKFGHLLLTTGNKSELATGYCTLYGDMCGGLAPLSDAYKGQVYALAREANRRGHRIPARVFEKPPTAELRPGQKDQDTLPPYEQLDQILKLILEDFLSAEEIIAKGFSADQVKQIFRWVGRSEYKRTQMPIGLKVSKKAFGVGRRIPVVHRFFE